MGIATFVCFIGMWIAFSVAVSWRALRFDHYWDEAADFYTTEALLVCFGSMIIEGSILLVTLACLLLTWRKRKRGGSITDAPGDNKYNAVEDNGPSQPAATEPKTFSLDATPPAAAPRDPAAIE